MPLQMIDTHDPLTDLVRFETSAVFEMIISLQTVLHPGSRTEWAAATRARLPHAFWREASEVYEPYFNGAIFFELAVDYPDQNDVPGFIEYVRRMPPQQFMFYVVGRIVTQEDIARTRLEPAALREVMTPIAEAYQCFCVEAPLEQILDDVPGFQNRLADVWLRYWDTFFSEEVHKVRPHWERGLNDKSAILARQGGQALLEYVTGKAELPPQLPYEMPVTEVVFIPLYLMPRRTLMFYGYGKVTVLFDTEMTEARLAEIARSKEQALEVLKALGDQSRLEILRQVVLSEGTLHGKKIAEKLNLSASAVSRHLTQLRDAGLIQEESQDNRTITYRFQKEAITTLPDQLLDYLYH